jgi:Pyruvate/2-oxoacid:ferredoxin oxidoreductase delta subunit
MNLDEAAPLLTTMASKFFIRGIKRPDGVRVFRLPYILPGLFEMPFAVRQPSSDLNRLGDLWEKYFAEGFGREFFSGSIQFARALPAIEPPKDQVMPHEDAVQIVQNASFPLIYPCMCRQAARNCDDPLDVCMVFGLELYGGNVPGQPVLDPAQMVDGPPKGRPVSIDEAVEVLKQSAQAGLVHCTMNVKEGFWLICNCCSHACHGLRGITQLDIPHAVAPSSYWVTVDEDLCNGCSACVERCHVDAIEMNDKMVAEIDYERCLGCGVCTFVCAPEALRLEKRDDRVFTPAADAHELFVMIGASKGRPYPVHQHPHG